MGQTSSRPKNNKQNQLETPNAIADLPFGDFSDPVFFTESTLYYFTSGNDSNSSNNSQKQKGDEIGRLLLYSYEQLTDIPSILDHVIKSNDVGDLPILRNLQNEFASYISYGIVRSDMAAANRAYLNHFFTQYTEIPKDPSQPNPNFRDLLKSLEEAYNCLTKKKYDKQILKNFTEFLVSAIPIPALPPPTADFIPQVRGHNELFTARYVNCHGSSSNGQFLFVLCADSRIQIFPILNLGSLMHPIQRELVMTVDYKASLIAKKTEIKIFSSLYEYVFSISSLFSTPENTPVEPISKTPKSLDSICYLSDCFTYARVKTDFTVSLYSLAEDKKLRTVKLQESCVPLAKEFPQLFPEFDYSLVPIFMNGSYIGFVFVVDPTNTIFRVFSLLTGKHVHDEKFRSDQFYSICLDMAQKAHWVVSLMENNRLGVRRYHFAGSYEPQPYLLDLGDPSSKKPYSQYIISLNNILAHYAGSLFISPLFITPDTNSFLHFIDLFTQFIRVEDLKKKDDYKFTLQSLCVIADINLRYLNQQCPEAHQIKDKMYTIIAELPLLNAAFLYFGSLKFFLRKIDDVGISFFVGLFKRIDDLSIRCYAIRHIPDSYAIAFIPFIETNALSQLMPTTPQSKNDAGKTSQTLLLYHQRIMIFAALSFLESSDKCEQLFDPNQTEYRAKNILNFLYEYANIIIENFTNIMEQCSSFNELEDSFILLLLNNFVMILSAITEYRVIAEVLTPVFAPLVSKIVQYIKTKNIDINDGSDLTHMILTFVLLYSKLISTLLHGGDLSDFDKQFLWLMKDVVSVVEKEEDSSVFTSPKIEEFEDEKINKFIKGETNIMPLIYKKFKPMMNRKLAPQVQEIDRISIYAICKWVNLTDELLNYDGKKPFSEHFRSALDCMLRIRSQFRNLIQHQQPTEDLIIKGLMLIRFNRIAATPTPQEVSNFILTKQTPDTILHVIKQKHMRNDLTLIGFDLAARILDLNDLDVFTRLFAYSLAKIPDFEGLGVILSIFTPNQEQNDKITHFFKRILNIIQQNPYPKLVLVSFRFFRDCNQFPDIEAQFLDGVLKIIDNDPKRITVFAIAMSLIPKTKSIPHSLKDMNFDNPVKLILLAECLKVNPCSEHFFNKIEKLFWKTPQKQLRVMCRVVFYACKSKHVPIKKIRDFVTKVIDFIGEQIVSYGDLVGTSEMVWLMRKMLNDGSEISSVVKDNFSIKICETFINSSMKDFEPGKTQRRQRIMSTSKITDLPVSVPDVPNSNITNISRGKRKSVPKIPIKKKKKDKESEKEEENEKEKEKEKEEKSRHNDLSDATDNDDDDDDDSKSSESIKDSSTDSERYYNEIRLCGLFAILNGFYEVLRPYCNVRIHFNRTSYMDCIAEYDDDNKEWICYPLPFNLKSKVLKAQFTSQDEVYAIDLETISPSTFPDFAFILHFFDHCFRDTKAPFAPVYAKTLASFLKFPDFAKLVTTKHIERLSRYPMPFNETNTTYRSRSGLSSKTIIPQVCGFGVLHFKDNKFTTYLSPQMKKDKVFDVKFKIKASAFNGYFGIITDNQDRFYTRYSLIHFPSGRWFPFNTIEVKFDQDDQNEDEYREVVFTVDRDDHKFSYNGHKMIFPIGSRFRVLIAVQSDVDIKIDTDFSVFDLTAPPSIQHHGKLFGNNKTPLYTLPQSVLSLEKTVWADVTKYEPIPDIVSSLNVGLKVMENFINPPDFIPIHAGFATAASQDIIDALYRGYNRSLVDEWSSVALMRIIRLFPEKVDNLDTLTKLFTIYLVPLENFGISRFNQHNFPFDLSEPVWAESTQTNALFMLLENEAKEALRNIIKKPNFEARLCSDVQSMTAKALLHMLAFPHHYHTYYPPGSYPAKLRVVSPNAIITMNSFHPIVVEGLVHEDKKYDLPFIKCGGDPYVQLSVLDRSLSILSINPNNNSWVYESAFELLLLMKSFIFFELTPEYRTVVKNSLIDCIVCQSPFVLNYLPQIIEFFQLHLPPSPFDKSTSFIQHLQLLGSFLKTYNGPESDRILSFYQQEQEVITSRYAVEIANFFPEFFSVPVSTPTKTEIKIPKMSLDPAAIKDDLPSYIKMLRMYSISYNTLVGFPFWDILPLWLRISGAWDDAVDRIDPTYENVNHEVVHVTNPSGEKIEIILSLKNNGVKLKERSLVMLSDSAEFTNAVFINSGSITTPIETTAKDTFMSLIDIDGLWNSLNIKVRVKRVKKDVIQNKTIPKMIDPRGFHTQFIEEMEEFAIKWTKKDTENLVMLLPRYALREPKFNTVMSIAKGSSLCFKYSQNVVLLRAAIIHHFNYIRYKHYKEVPKHLWDSMYSFVSIEDAADAITESIKCTRDDNFATFQIDRRSAHHLIVDGKGSYSRSIISQLTRQFKKISKSKLQCKARPWKIRFTGEQAIDAGGPTRELMTEAASSIFEPTSQLTVRVPNGRRGEGKNQMTYIPFDQTGRRYDDYQTIGTFIGMILRTGFSQDLPFAPLVWKFMAKEIITVDDIIDIDSEFGEHIKQMREASNGTGEGETSSSNFETHFMFTWAIEQWDGTMLTLPGHTEGSIVKKNQVEQYITEAIQFRIRSIYLPLKEMRKAFQINVNFKKHNMLTGSLLSRMAQGSSVISSEHLKSITIYSVELPGGANNEYVKRFWKVVDRLNDEQKKLLLRFITTLTRLPNPVINPSFKLQIDKMATKTPDESLPTASTCFNRLHLPTYSDDDIAYQKILYAIQFCQTMENQ